MARQMFLLLNHSLTETQRKVAEKEFDIRQFLALPDSLKKLWEQVPAETDHLKDYLSPLKAWVSEKARDKDVIMIQGDFGATYLMIEFSIEKGLLPVYATSVRKASETVYNDGSVRMEHVFNFCKFRQYGL